VNTLLDPVLGPADEQVSAGITGICGDAVHAILGPGLAPAALTDSALLTRIARWARDLQFRDRSPAQARAEPGRQRTRHALAARTRAGYRFGGFSNC
jgi:hypothetical protein